MAKRKAQEHGQGCKCSGGQSICPNGRRLLDPLGSNDRLAACLANDFTKKDRLALIRLDQNMLAVWRHLRAKDCQNQPWQSSTTAKIDTQLCVQRQESVELR